jgi:hypothetical protein
MSWEQNQQEFARKSKGRRKQARAAKRPGNDAVRQTMPAVFRAAILRDSPLGC